MRERSAWAWVRVLGGACALAGQGGLGCVPASPDDSQANAGGATAAAGTDSPDGAATEASGTDPDASIATGTARSCGADAGLRDPHAFEDAGSPEEALADYQRRRTAASCPVQLTRRGKPLTLDYAIK
jgi:hypothetical protein